MTAVVKGRRGFLVASAALLTTTLFGMACGGCRKELRCKHCGMRIDPNSAWRTELVGVDGSVTAFDTPRCALTSWRTAKTPARSIRVQEYYDRRFCSGEDARFVVGGDVVGPMGPDLVPVDPTRVTKFIQDHSADRSLRLEEITVELLASIH